VLGRSFAKTTVDVDLVAIVRGKDEQIEKALETIGALQRTKLMCSGLDLTATNQHGRTDSHL
jgi:hypothetical protein